MQTHTELTSQQSADILNVSRPFLIELLEKGEIPYRKVGAHRIIKTTDLMSFKERDDAKCRIAIEELTADAQIIVLGY